MTLSRVRFTTFGMMAFVATSAVALAIWVAAMRASHQAQEFRIKAAELALLEQSHRNKASSIYNSVTILEVNLELRRERAIGEREQRRIQREERWAAFQRELLRFEDAVADHFHGLVEKYSHAANSPWESITPDPPLPKSPPRKPFDIL